MRRVLVMLVAVLVALPMPAAAATSSPLGASDVESRPDADPAAAAPTDVLGSWRFDEGSGTTAADSSGNALTGTIQGSTWVGRRSGKALSFSSWTDRVVVPRSALLEPTTVTVDAWVRANGTPGQWAQIVGKGETVCTNASYSLYTGTGKGLSFFIGNGTSWVETPAAGTSIWDNAWHHIAGSFDGTKVRLYVDGAEIGTGTPTNGMQIGYGMTLTNDLSIGSALTQCPGGNKPWVGQIDNVRVWGRALSLAEIQALLPPTSTTLASSPNPSTPGGSVDLTATVSPSSATGTVTFTDVTGGASTALGTAPLSAGVASISTSFAAAGQRKLVASYGGSPDYDPSTSPTLTHRVASATLTPTTTALSVTPNPVAAGSPATFSATVAPIPSTGDIEWLIDGAPAGTTAVGPDGKASTTHTWVDPGAHTIQAHFVEGTTYADSLSDTVPLTVSPVAFVVTLTAVPPVVVTNSTTHLTATVKPGAAGTITFYRGTTLLSTQALAEGGQATLDPVVPAGASVFKADYTPTGSSAVAASATVVVQGKQGTTISLGADRSTAVSGETVVTFTAVPGDYDATGTVTFRDVTGPTPKTLGTANIAEDADYNLVAVLRARLTGAGAHAVDAVYNGDATYAPATSNLVAINVSPDVGVSASGVGVSSSTFYPYKDGYRDTVSIRGTPGEPVSVSVRVYNGSGRLVRTWALPTRSNAWAIAWNGRTASGTLLAAGRYKVVQTLRDVPGHTKAVTAYTTISNKRLRWYSGSITRYGNQYALYNYSTFGWVLPSDKYYRGVNIYGNIYDSWAWVGYSFTLPSATTYGTLTFKVVGTPWTGRGVPYISLWNFGNGEEDGNRWVGRSYAWYSTSVSGPAHVNSSHKVRAYVTVMGENEGWYDVARVQLTYRYALLR